MEKENTTIERVPYHSNMPICMKIISYRSSETERILCANGVLK